MEAATAEQPIVSPTSNTAAIKLIAKKGQNSPPGARDKDVMYRPSPVSESVGGVMERSWYGG
jgi:hypothetical protein